MRRTARALVGFGTVLAALFLGAAPALADGDEVRLRLPGRFTAGGAPEQVLVEVVRADDDCVRVTMVLEVALIGVRDGQVRVDRLDDGRWRRLPLERAGANRFAAAPVSPTNPVVCGDSRPRAAVLLRVGLGAGVTAREVKLVGRAFSGSGQQLDATDESRTVRSAPRPAPPKPAPSPTASPTPGVSPTPTPAATASAQPGAPSSQAAPVVELPGPLPPADQPPAGSATPTSQEGGWLTTGRVLTALIVALVALGALLLDRLVRSRRRANAAKAPTGVIGPDEAHTGAAADAMSLAARHRRRGGAGWRGWLGRG